jgi:hypothetical protein
MTSARQYAQSACTVLNNATIEVRFCNDTAVIAGDERALSSQEFKFSL